MNPTEKRPVAYRLINLDDHDSIRWALMELGLCRTDCELEKVSKAGEGNMNVVVRVRVNGQSYILKQSRPWVEKYPSIAAPDDRLLAEIDFYDLVAAASRQAETTPEIQIAAWMPQVLGRSIEHRLMALQDLGVASDYTALYSGRSQQGESAERVFTDAVRWIARVHRLPIDEATGSKLGCDELRRLNHDHIFAIPMMEPPALALDDVCMGLDRASRDVRSDRSVHAAMSRLGEIYLAGRSDRSAERRLLHGDFYPGSWLRTDAGFRVIDPEFCFAGPVEFDLGVLSAHRILCQSDADQGTVSRTCEQYREHGGATVAQSLVEGFAGAEIVRRLIGVAQLPIQADLATRVQWLLQARELLARR